ncbi:enoyl-CoA hydratase/carnithine racemase [Variovorax paradoxus]|uniref:enoyl-CoA hydratase/isomerase family protein n=1 Tax=Variovorax paradoxus TaxID=34073 RepID=UPI002784114E|nr:enoyl-CoA hydratase/isomerase family protein [Variovorax paradoxus]MDP9962904.1 enoyl-CoA hydratase/carnithine racemase [Variovorax paradoxus]
MEQVRYEVLDGIAEITLANPPANALTEQMVGQVIAALDRAAQDADAAAVIIRSAVDRRFCAGLDLLVLAGASDKKVRSLLDKLYPGLLEAQMRLDKPSIAAVAGAARGGGMTLAISCDLLVAGRSASFGYPEIDVGVLPAIHFTHLPRVVGRHRAFDLLFTGRTFGAEEAQSLGLVSRVVPDDRVMEEARNLAHLLTRKSPRALKTGRKAFHNACDNGYRQGVEAAVDIFCGVATSTEGREGLQAFVEKREPSWGGER